MPPNRRKGAGKAAAAAAARRQWKVGDLVLAKVKGFPAWPATVSEPEKWGYQSDWKKVLVYFFGTQQIAFCNPADVEAFTEEKKQSLLMKRQGKGADFGRAVQEIIESYEKSKKPDDDQHSGEVTLAHGGTSLESKDQYETSEVADLVRDDPRLDSSNSPDVAKIDSLRDKEASLEQPSDDVATTAKPGITTYTSRKRSGGLRSRKRAAQKNDSSVEMSRSLSQLESGRFQNIMMPCNDGNKSAGDASAEIVLERSLRRNKRIRKSTDASEWDDVDSSAVVSNGSMEDNGSEIVMLDSDSLSLNESSPMYSAGKPEHSETVVECLEGDVELSKGLDFQIKAVVIKKKRKPNRKRATNEAAEQSAKLETRIDLDAGIQNIVQNSQNSGQSLNERHNKEDGDEHLPLVKRARVRMGKLSTLEEGNGTFVQAEEKTSNSDAVNQIEACNSFSEVEERISKEVAVTSVEQVGLSTSLNDDCVASGSSIPVKGTSDNASPPSISAQIPGNRLHLSITKENQSFGCSADGEAALPPSKRLHRALEAMSANAAEEGHACAETSVLKTLVNGSCTSSARGSSHMAIERNGNGGSGEQSVESFRDKASELCSSNVISEATVKSLLDVDISNQPMESSKSQEKHEDILPGDSGDDRCKDFCESCSGGLSVCKAVQQSTDVMHSLDRRGPSLLSNEGSLNESLLAKDKVKSEDIVLRGVGAEIPSKDVALSECSRTTQASEASKGTSQNGSNMLAEDTESLRSQIDDSSQADGMLEGSKGIKYEQRRKEANLVSFSDDHVGERDILVAQSSPVHGMDSPPQISPTTTSVCHVSTSESANFIQNSGCSSPNHSQQKISVCAAVVDEEKIESAVPQRPKSVGKLSIYAEAHAALSSFEGVLGSLTRTKESIGRATRIAIDCAKFGVSSKVVEILARNLESESSLHKKVDLFFLVDSIMQCSRGLKGDVGGAYPSAIQQVLPRLLSAAAPPGSFAQENRRQCLKVLRLWLERRILPESVIRHHMRELDSLGGSSSAGPYSRRSARTERALDDPVRDMEGMLVDEYGSNSSFQLPGFCMPRMLKDEDDGSDSDGESFEAVTPEHNPGTPEEQENAPATEKHTHILEDVDGELEMEDVAPSCGVEVNSTGGIAGVNAVRNVHHQLEQQFPLPFAPPPLPQDVPPSSPPLPTSPPPPPPPPPPPSGPPSCGMCDPYLNGIDSKLYTNSHNMHDSLRESVAQQPAASRTNPSMSNGVPHHATESRDQMHMQVSDPASCFSSYPVQPVNDNVQQTDGPNFHHKAYPPRPPHPPPPNQFSYVQAGQHVKSRRETPPPSYHHRFHSSNDADGGNFYNNHERMRPPPYELNESWRYPAPNFPGPRYPDRARASYPPGPYGPPREPTRVPQQNWSFPPRGMHHRNFMPYGPPPESAGPVSNRAPSIWQPR